MTELTQQNSYNEIPYVVTSTKAAHPDVLATVARIFGVPSPELAGARVLELGCASGGQLLPLALQLRDTQFIGIDRSSRQIQDADQDRVALGLGNVQFRCASIMDVDESWGKFDYIIAHGVFSWVPRAVQDKLLMICRDLLTPNGVAHVSFNANPGWRMRGIARDLMLYHAQLFPTTQEKVEQARAAFKYFASATDPAVPYGAHLRQELEIFGQQPDGYLYHEFMEETNTAFYLHEFVERLAPYQLQYLGDSSYGSMLPLEFSPEVIKPLTTAMDQVRFEQYLDFLRNRTFRNTLVVHRDHVLTRQPDMNQVESFRAAGKLKPQIAFDPEGSTPIQFDARSGKGNVLARTRVTRLALQSLAIDWPRAKPLAQLVDEVAAATPPEGGRSIAEHRAWVKSEILPDLFLSYAGGLVELTTVEDFFATAVPPRPVVSPWARICAARGHALTNLRGDIVELDPLGLRILPMLDGSTDRRKVAQLLREFEKSGALTVGRDARGIRPASLEAFDQIYDTLVNGLADWAMLMP